MRPNERPAMSKADPATRTAVEEEEEDMVVVECVWVWKRSELWNDDDGITKAIDIFSRLFKWFDRWREN
jgi:hypothetical protein